MASYAKPEKAGSLQVVAGGAQGAAAVPSAARTPAESAAFGALVERSRSYKESALAKSTRASYDADWRHFAAWCKEQGYTSLPAEPVAVDLYLTDHADTFKPATLARRLVSISRAHKAAGYNSPAAAAAVRSTFQGICREQGTAQSQKAPVLTDELRKMVTARDDGTLLGLRDRALLLLGWAGAMRASELVSLFVTDLTPTAAGMIVTIRRSKTDQRGEGQRIGILFGQSPETCPVKVVRNWMMAAQITRGPLLRGVDRYGNVGKVALGRNVVTHVVKRAAAVAGLEAGLEAGLYSAHSLRAGLATSAALAGADNRSIKKQTRHKSDRVLERYIRDAELFRDNAQGKTGL